MGNRSKTCHPGSSLRRTTISRKWVYKSQEDLSGFLASTQIDTFVVGTKLTLSGGYGGQLAYPSTISFFLTDAAGQNLVIWLEISGYDADGNRTSEVVKMGPITEAVNQVFQTNKAWLWIESITPIRLDNVAATVDLIQIGTRYSAGAADPGGALALPGHFTANDEVKVFVRVPGAGIVALTTINEMPTRPFIDYERQLFSPPAAGAGRWFLFVSHPARE